MQWFAIGEKTLEQGLPCQLSIRDLVVLSQKYGKEKDKSQALSLYAYMRSRGLDTCNGLGNHLVSMLVDVGSLHDAQLVFDGLVHRSVLSWNSLIIGYVKFEKPQYAVELYNKMHVGLPVQLNRHAFVALLKASAKLNDLETGAKVHDEVVRLGLCKDPFIGSSLIAVYAKCGVLERAQQVFDDLPFHNIVVWNSLIAGYVAYGYGEEALQCFEEMHRKDFCPDAVTFVCSLKACCSLGAIEKGREIHVEIERQRLREKNLLVGNSLVDIYAKCGYVAIAQQVFNELTMPDMVSWNSLISGYVEHEHGEEALRCVEQMQQRGFSPNAITCVCCLKSCGQLQDISKGQGIHAEIERQGLLKVNQLVGSSLVDMYAKCGLLNKAQLLFNTLPPQDTVSWNALISGYADNGCGDEALECFTKMQLVGVSPDSVTLICCLKACGDIGDIEQGLELHAQMEKLGVLECDVVLCSTLLDMYAKCGSLEIAQRLFDRLADRNLVSWNALIAGYAEHGHGEKALQCFEQMQLEGVFLDSATVLSLLKACGSVGAKDRGRRLRVEIERQGMLEEHPLMGNALVDMYSKCGLLVDALEVFEKIPVKDIISWNALLSGYAEHKHDDEVLEFFQHLQSQGLSPNGVTFVYSLKVCINNGASDRGRLIHAEIERHGLLDKDPIVGNNLVNMYSKCGLLVTAQQVFDRLPIQDVASWTALMAGYAHGGESDTVFLNFDKMLVQGVQPNVVTYIVVLSTCSHMGLLKKSPAYFEVMSRDFGVVPTLEHYTCLIDLLGRVGRLQEAEETITRMPCHSDLVVCNAMLEACKMYGNLEVGTHGFKHAVSLSHTTFGGSVCLHILHHGRKVGKSRVFCEG